MLSANANKVSVDLWGDAAPLSLEGDRAQITLDSIGDAVISTDLTLKMSHLAHHDFLTGLPNRLLLSERLAQTIASAHCHHESLAVMFLDMDGFKPVNDSLGHAVGDRLLQSIARRLVARVRGWDTVSRQGGDEFIVLLTQMSSPEDAACIAEKMVNDSKLPHYISSHCLLTTASIGIGTYPADGEDAETLLKNADLALLRAKTQGRGIYRFFSA